jgi:hypothetical protein
MKYSVLLLFLTSVSIQSQQILPQRQRAEVIDNVLKERFNTLLPRLMDETGFDMWVLISREYNEDPVLKQCSQRLG